MLQFDRPAAVRPAAARPAAVRTAAAVRPGIGRPASLLALCVALLIAAMLALPTPAQAHDTLLSTDPADGSTLEVSPELIAFTFSSDILDVSPLVRISDASGAEVAEIVPTVEGPVATAELAEPLPAGTYDIQWRVVSGDGHPIEGTLTLTVEQDPVEEQAPGAASDAGGDEPAASDAGGAESAGAGDAPSADETGGSEDPAGAGESAEGGSGLPMPALLGILAVIVVGAVTAGVLILRRRD